MTFLHLACFTCFSFSSWSSVAFIAFLHVFTSYVWCAIMLYMVVFQLQLVIAFYLQTILLIWHGTTGISRRRPRSNGRSRLDLFPRQFRGASESFYLIFAYPLHKHLVLNIILFIADEDADFTWDIYQLSVCSSFMWKRCMTFRCVDTPSLASEDDSFSRDRFVWRFR